MIDPVEEALDVQIQYPVHPLPRQPDGQRIQRFVRGAPRSESVAEVHEVLFVDLFEHPYQCLLNDLVLQRGDPDRTLPTVRLGQPDPS